MNWRRGDFHITHKDIDDAKRAATSNRESGERSWSKEANKRARTSEFDEERGLSKKKRNVFGQLEKEGGDEEARTSSGDLGATGNFYISKVLHYVDFILGPSCREQVDLSTGHQLNNAKYSEYRRQLSLGGEKNMFLLDWGWGVVRNCDNSGKLIVPGLKRDFLKSEISLWMASKLCLFKDNQGTFAIWACEKCMKDVMSMDFRQENRCTLLENKTRSPSVANVAVTHVHATKR